jgi:hypothetical protein
MIDIKNRLMNMIRAVNHLLMCRKSYHLKESASKASLRHLWRKEEKALMCHSYSILKNVIYTHTFIKNKAQQRTTGRKGFAHEKEEKQFISHKFHILFWNLVGEHGWWREDSSPLGYLSLLSSTSYFLYICANNMMLTWYIMPQYLPYAP